MHNTPQRTAPPTRLTHSQVSTDKIGQGPKTSRLKSSQGSHGKTSQGHGQAKPSKPNKVKLSQPNPPQCLLLLAAVTTNPATTYHPNSTPPAPPQQITLSRKESSPNPTHSSAYRTYVDFHRSKQRSSKKPANFQQTANNANHSRTPSPPLPTKHTIASANRTPFRKTQTNAQRSARATVICAKSATQIGVEGDLQHRHDERLATDGKLAPTNRTNRPTRSFSTQGRSQSYPVHVRV